MALAYAYATNPILERNYMSKETIDLILRMPPPLHKKICSAAKKDARSLNNMIIQLLKKALDS